MDKLSQKLTERAALSQQMAALDAEIIELYNAQHPITPDSEFIIQARADCERLLKALRGHPHKLLKTILASPLGVVDYDETVEIVWPDGIKSARTVRSTIDYIILKLRSRKAKYTISASQHAVMQLDIRRQ